MVDFISTIRLPRCYFNFATSNTYNNAELHTFVDASETAYACAVYIRVTQYNGEVKCALISANSKVAPLKPTSIPRLELQACVLGVRLSKFVQEHHTVSLKRRLFWTDSRTAKSWIQADPRNYRPFVAHRVAEILEFTRVDEWKWVPSKMNPADEATKWGSGPFFCDDSQWFRGPDFLALPEEEWPRSSNISVVTTEEIRASVLHHTEITPLFQYKRFSTWKKLHRTVGYVLRFLNNSSSELRRKSGPLQQEELQAAQDTILGCVQRESYPDEMTILEKNNESPRDVHK